MSLPTDITRQAYAVNPTPTEVVEIDTRDTRLLAGVVTNLDGSQTITGEVLARTWSGDDAGVTAYSELILINPGETKPFAIDCAVFQSLILRFTASGAGCDVRISARPDRGRR